MQILSADAVCAVVILANAAAPTAVFAQATFPTQDVCVFHNEAYSFGTFICIGKDRALRYDGPSPSSGGVKNAHWTLVKPDDPNPYNEATKLGDACNVGGPSGPQ
jgi:hypothetical protein